MKSSQFRPHRSPRKWRDRDADLAGGISHSKALKELVTFYYDFRPYLPFRDTSRSISFVRFLFVDRQDQIEGVPRESAGRVLRGTHRRSAAQEALLQRSADSGGGVGKDTHHAF